MPLQRTCLLESRENISSCPLFCLPRILELPWQLLQKIMFSPQECIYIYMYIWYIYMNIISVVFANHPFPEDRQGLCLSFSPKKVQRTWPLSIFRLPKHLSILMSICQHLRHAHWVTRTSMTCWTRSKPPMRRSLGILSTKMIKMNPDELGFNIP